MSPTARTLAFLRREGFTAGVVERRLPHCFTTVDLFGCLDIVCLSRAFQGVYGVQCTSGSNHSSRVKKCIGSPEARLWVEQGNRLSVISWTKPANQRFWKVRIEDITLEMFEQGVPA